MLDYLGLLIPIIAVSMPIWIVWIVFHYRSKNRQQEGLSAEEIHKLDELESTAESMAERIKNLEAILDVEAPNWRDSNEQQR